MAVKAVDSNLCEAAVLTIILHSDARLEIKTVSQRTGTHVSKEFACGNIYQRRALAPLGLALGSCDNHLVQHKSIRL